MTRLDTKNPLLAPYTEGDTMLLLPFTESAAIAAKMMDRTFIKYKFYAKTQPNKVKISSFYNKPNLQIESTFSKSIITLTKRHPDRSAEDLQVTESAKKSKYVVCKYLILFFCMCPEQ